MKKISPFLILGLLLLSGLYAFLPDNTLQASNKNEPKSLTVNKAHVTNSDSITLSFPLKHPAKLAIKDPNNNWFVIHEDGVTTKLITTQQYLKATSLHFKLAELKGVTWINGKKVERNVFTVSGEYMIYMADNLETEPENTVYLTTTINYKAN